VTDNSKKPKEAKKVIPPPPNFNDLLELAKEKCKEPVVIKKPKLDLEEEKYEFGRPMTAKEKAQYLQEKAIRARISVPNFDTKTSDKNNNLRTKGNASSITGKGQPSFKIPSKAGKASVPTPSPVSPSPPVQQVNSKLGPSARVPVPQSSAPPKILSRTLGSTSAQAPSYSQNSKESLKPKTSVSLGAGGGGSKHGSPSGISSKPPKSLPNEKNIHPGKPVSTLQSTSASKNRPPGSYDPHREKPGQRRDRIDIDKHPKHSVPSQRQQEHDRNGPSMQQRNPISNHSDRRREPERSQLPQKSSKQSNLPPPRRELPTSRPGRQIIDSDDDEGEDDYDSEMDDFIDDSDLNGGNISDIIRKITGYDKRRYQDGSDDECMESSAYEQMREESRSLRIGIQEDLEDMRLEQEEKKRKALLAKKRKK
jgi:protein SPT2